MSLRRRLQRLEDGLLSASREDEPCTECGWDPEGPNLQVEWEDPSPEEYVAWLKDWYERGCLPHEAEHRGQPDPCPNCGAQVVIVDWDDADRAKMFRRECERLKACNWDVETFFASQTGKPKDNQVPDYPPSSWSGGSSPNGRS